jgi:methylase of polypeptide subunit release factors
MMEFLIPGKEHFRVYYNSDQDGGGTWFGQEYVSVIQQRYHRQFGTCLEWCSGPGFIGFALLAHGVCDQLCLMDKHAPAAEAVTATSRANLCGDKVSFHCCDRIQDLQHSSKFNLIVANPPHYLECPGDDNYRRIAVDTGWQTHREFYANIGRHMHQDSIILLQENQAGSLDGPAEFRDMIDRAGLQITGYFTSQDHYNTQGPTQIYYLEVQLR